MGAVSQDLGVLFSIFSTKYNSLGTNLPHKILSNGTHNSLLTDRNNGVSCDPQYGNAVGPYYPWSRFWYLSRQEGRGGESSDLCHGRRI